MSAGTMKIECPRAWVFGDDINTDAIAPSAYMMAPAAGQTSAGRPKFSALR